MFYNLLLPQLTRLRYTHGNELNYTYKTLDIFLVLPLKKIVNVDITGTTWVPSIDICWHFHYHPLPPSCKRSLRMSPTPGKNYVDSLIWFSQTQLDLTFGVCSMSCLPKSWFRLIPFTEVPRMSILYWIFLSEFEICQGAFTFYVDKR